MASYDHDLREVAEVRVAGSNKDGTKLEDAPFRDAVMKDLREIFTPDATYAGAFAKLIAKLIGRRTDRYGLIVLDPNRREFMALARPILEKALFDGAGANEAIASAGQAIEALGATPTIDHNGDVSPVFFVDEGLLRPLVEDAVLLTIGYVGRSLAKARQRDSSSACSASRSRRARPSLRATASSRRSGACRAVRTSTA